MTFGVECPQRLRIYSRLETIFEEMEGLLGMWAFPSRNTLFPFCCIFTTFTIGFEQSANLNVAIIRWREKQKIERGEGTSWERPFFHLIAR